MKNDTANRGDGLKAEVQSMERSGIFTLDHERNLSLERLPSGDGGYTSSTSRPISNASMDANDEAEPSSSELKKSSSPTDQAGSRSTSRGPRLFSEVFALGCSIAFRWAVVSSPKPQPSTDLLTPFHIMKILHHSTASTHLRHSHRSMKCRPTAKRMRRRPRPT